MKTNSSLKLEHYKSFCDQHSIVTLRKDIISYQHIQRDASTSVVMKGIKNIDAPIRDGGLSS